MNLELFDDYYSLRENGFGFFNSENGLIEVSGLEAVMFLNGLITNDIAKLDDNSWMLAAFPNAQGRLVGVVRVLRQDAKFLFITEPETHAKILKNLERFTLAGDFKIKDLTQRFQILSLWGTKSSQILSQILGETANNIQENKILHVEYNGEAAAIINAFRWEGFEIILTLRQASQLKSKLLQSGAKQISDFVKEVLRIENGIPKYGVDMDETTIVLETGLNEAVSFNKGCYIGQEIIARIHFRGHVAKQLTGLILSEASAFIGGLSANQEIKSFDGKNAGRITSLTFSPKLEKLIALAYVRYDYLAEGTELKVGATKATVKHLPFISKIS
jgi:folate-binding protein YgfZ